jgi:quercetin dioxygenase-like cupin family protein
MGDYSFSTRHLRSEEAIMAEVPGTPKAGSDPVEVDPKHYSVEFENERVRVLRVRYGPHEKSTPHRHPASVAVYLSDGDFLFYSQGRKQSIMGRKGQIICFEDPVEHAPENMSDMAFEAVLIELKD